MQGRSIGLLIALVAGVASAAVGQPVAEGGSVLEVIYVYSPDCEKCREAEETIDEAGERYGDRIRVIRLNIREDEDLMRIRVVEDRYGSVEPSPPKVFVGEQYLAGLEAIVDGLVATIEQELAREVEQPTTSIAPADDPGDDLAKGEALLIEDFSSYTAGAVAIAGLVDGVNPCAFTTIVFMLSMLTFLGRSRRELAIVGAAFTTAVFVTYLLLGIGILEAIRAFAVTAGISAGLTYTIAALTFALAGWSFFDAIRIARTGRAPKGALGLPEPVKRRIHKVIRVGLKTPSLVAGAFAVGCVISVLESICTGQVYIPTIVFVLGRSDYRWQAIMYLVLYNVMFILPLAFLVVLSYWGVGSKRIGAVMTRHLGLAKVLMGLLFVGLGVLLLMTV